MACIAQFEADTRQGWSIQTFSLTSVLSMDQMQCDEVGRQLLTSSIRLIQVYRLVSMHH
ncbi:hypothetical protein BDV33DRAFT_172925 [Aspergillus novoparasiticus]|uniref:Uncharacterized protein n=1 Tax=Aspergillus novoparasiticus TaxID=986946 RepID=A0A5N6ERT7_9EURO|nr:hypothetical protein BDV33DRAFT_172925 [Aspergillus novoparasiticus]